MILISLHLYGSGLVLYPSIYLVSVWILEACPRNMPARIKLNLYCTVIRQSRDRSLSSRHLVR